MSIKVFICLLMITVLLNYSVTAFAKENVKPVERSKVLFTVGGLFHDQPELYPILNKILEDTGNFTGHEPICSEKIGMKSCIAAIKANGAMNAKRILH